MRPVKHKQLPVNGKTQIIGPSLLESQKMVVWHEMDCVKFDLGGHIITMEYPSAIKLSDLLRVHGKQAKKFAGDFGKHWSTEASVLTDAELNYKKGW